jgi:hypothetical protein
LDKSKSKARGAKSICVQKSSAALGVRNHLQNLREHVIAQGFL